MKACFCKKGNRQSAASYGFIQASRGRCTDDRGAIFLEKKKLLIYHLEGALIS